MMSNSTSTLSKLPPLPAHKAGKSIWKTPSKPGRPAATIPKIKAVAKMAQKMGKSVTEFSLNADGGFTIKVSEGTTSNGSTNPFDVVLK